MTDSQREECHLIIHGASASAAAVGGGMAQLPMADAAVIVPIQITMTVALGAVFDVHLTKSAAEGLVLGMAGTQIGRLASQVLVGWIPGFGNAVNAGTAASITEALGWAVVSRLEKGELA